MRGVEETTTVAPVVHAWTRRLLSWSERLVFEQPLYRLILVVTLLDLLKNGFGATPEIAYWASMARAFPHHFVLPPGSDYILTSPIGPAIGHYVGATTSNRFELLSLVAVIAALAVVLIGLGRRGGNVAVRVGIVALFASPLSNIVLTWLGKEDPFLILGSALGLLFDSAALTFMGGVILAVANPEAGVVIAALAAGLRLLGERDRLEGSVMLAVGFCIGLVPVAAYSSAIHASFGGRVAFARAEGAQEFVKQFLSELPTWIFSVFGAWWVSLVCFWEGALDRFERVVAIGVLVLCAGVTAATLDQTRIFALLSLPLVLWFVVRSVQRIPTAHLRTITVWTLLIAIAVPHTVVFDGTTYVSHFVNVLNPFLL